MGAAASLPSESEQAATEVEMGVEQRYRGLNRVHYQGTLRRKLSSYNLHLKRTDVSIIFQDNDTAKQGQFCDVRP